MIFLLYGLGGRSENFMQKKKKKFYPINHIYIGHVTTVNPDAWEKEEEFQKKVAVFQKVKNDAGFSLYLPLSEHFPYFINQKMIPIKKYKKKLGLITESEIEKILIDEQAKLEQEKSEKVSSESKQSKDSKNVLAVNPVMEEQINKAKQKKLVA